MRLPPPTMQLGRSQGGDHTAAEVVNPCRWSASRSYRSPMVYPSSTPAIPNCHPSVPRTKLRSIHLQCQPTIVDPHPKPTPGYCTSPLQNPQQQSQSPTRGIPSILYLLSHKDVKDIREGMIQFQSYVHWHWILLTSSRVSSAASDMMSEAPDDSCYPCASRSIHRNTQLCW